MKIAFIIALRYILGRKGNFFTFNAYLSLIGVFIGCLVLTLVLSIFNGFQRQMQKSIYDFNPHISLRKYHGKSQTGIEKSAFYINKIKSQAYIKSVSTSIESAGILQFNNEILHMFIRGIEMPRGKLPDFFPNLVIGKNQNIGIEDAFIGEELAKYIGLKIGDIFEIIAPKGQFTMRLGMRPSMLRFKVAGLFKTGNYKHDTNVTIISMKAAQALFAVGNQVMSIDLRLNKIEKLNQVINKIYEIWPFSIEDIESENKTFFSALQLEKTIMTIIVFLIILASMVGIVIATSNTVRSKKRDIGLLKSLGLSSRSILMLFTINGFIMGMLGTLLGVSFGIFLAQRLELIINAIEYGINWFSLKLTTSQDFYQPIQLIPKDVYYFDSLPVFIQVDYLLSMAITTIFLSGIASLVSAWSAIRLEPIKILRGEE